MTREEHIARHKLLHGMADELYADFLNCHEFSALSELIRRGVTVNELMQWSHKQTIEPDLPRWCKHDEPPPENPVSP